MQVERQGWNQRKSRSSINEFVLRLNSWLLYTAQVATGSFIIEFRGIECCKHEPGCFILPAQLDTMDVPRVVARYLTG